MNSALKKIFRQSTFILGLVLCVYAASIVNQCQVQEALAPPGTSVLRISHSRLEPGYANALDAIIADFKEYKARQGVSVDIQQNVVATTLYEPWLNTQLVGGTAPDIVEVPGTKQQGHAVYNASNFHSLNRLTSRPNPFNDFRKMREVLGDLDLNRNVSATMREQYPDLREPLTVSDAIAGIDPAMREILSKQSHRDTFMDGMSGGYNYPAAQYYRFIISGSQRRILYNKDLIQEAIGQPDPPHTLEAFLELCEKLSQLETNRGRPVIPIAATMDTPRWIFHENYYHAFSLASSYSLQPDMMFGLGGGYYWSYLAGDTSIYDDHVRAFYEFAKELSRHMTPGYQSLDRASATFDFVQGRAAMRISETEEAPALFNQADFPIGIMPLPHPGPGERWYEYAMYPRRDINRATGQMALTRQSDNMELALEFMQFWTSRIWNERFNRFADLVPVITTSEPSERLKPFLPLKRGVIGIPEALKLEPSRFRPDAIRDGEEWRYLSGEIDYETFADTVHAAYMDPRRGINLAVAIYWDGEWRYAKQADGALSILAGKEILLPGPAGINRSALDYIIFRSVIYNNGTTVPYLFDRIHWGQPNPPPIPRF